jgi:hypothetical protein
MAARKKTGRKKTAKKASRKPVRTLTEAGRQAISRAAKKRWAAFWAAKSRSAKAKILGRSPRKGRTA